MKETAKAQYFPRPQIFTANSEVPVSMKVICCYRNMESRAAAALEKYAPMVEMVDTSASIYTYNEVIASHWTGKYDLIVIEEDKEITADVIPAFSNCNHLWCAFEYDIYPEPYCRTVSTGLGCTRYSAEIQRVVGISEFLCDDLPCWGMCGQCKGKGCWRYLDSRMAHAIRGHGVDVSVHGFIEHHHDYMDHNLNNSFDVAAVLMQRAQDGSHLQRQYPDDILAGPAWQRMES